MAVTPINLAESIAELASKESPGGKRLYSDDDVMHTFCFLIVASAFSADGDAVTEALIPFMGVAIKTAAIPESLEGEALVLALARYYQRTPPHPELVEEIAKLVSQQLGIDPSDAAAKFASLTGATIDQRPVGADERKPGQIGGGALGMLAAMRKTDDDS